MELLLNYAKGYIAIFDTKIFDHLETRNNKSFNFEVESVYRPVLHELDDYLLGSELMTLEPEITGKKQHNLRFLYMGTAYPYSLKLICSCFKNHYVVLGY